jgi:hypothetical protein
MFSTIKQLFNTYIKFTLYKIKHDKYLKKKILLEKNSTDTKILYFLPYKDVTVLEQHFSKAYTMKNVYCFIDLVDYNIFRYIFDFIKGKNKLQTERFSKKTFDKHNVFRHFNFKKGNYIIIFPGNLYGYNFHDKSWKPNFFSTPVDKYIKNLQNSYSNIVVGIHHTDPYPFTNKTDFPNFRTDLVFSISIDECLKFDMHLLHPGDDITQIKTKKPVKLKVDPRITLFKSADTEMRMKKIVQLSTFLQKESIPHCFSVTGAVPENYSKNTLASYNELKASWTNYMYNRKEKGYLFDKTNVLIAMKNENYTEDGGIESLPYEFILALKYNIKLLYDFKYLKYLKWYDSRYMRYIDFTDPNYYTDDLKKWINDDLKISYNYTDELDSIQMMNHIKDVANKKNGYKGFYWKKDSPIQV